MLPKIGEPREALKAVNYPNMFGVFFLFGWFFLSRMQLLKS